MTRPRLDHRRLRKIPWHARYRLGSHMASELRRLAIAATHRHCRVEFCGPVRIGPGFALHIEDHGTLLVGPGVDFRRGFVCEISGAGRVSIGGGCIFTAGTLIQCTTSIEIGDGCIFSQDALLVDGKHRYGHPTAPILEQGYDYRPLRIGDGVAVMAKCTIFADIGEGTMVGAHSVVSRDLPARCLAMGAPARPVSSFVSAELAANGRGKMTAPSRT